MNKKILIFGILAILLMLPTALAWSNPYGGSDGVTYATARPSVYGQYNTRYNSVYGGAGYVPVNAWGKAGQPWYYRTSAYRPVLSTRCNNLFGCDRVQTGNMYIGSAIDYAYYSTPDLFAVRYMNNHQRSIKNLRPQTFVW